MSYSVNEFSDVTRDEDGATIPNDPTNIDWIEYQRWLAEGNSPTPYVPPPPPVPDSVPLWAVRTVLQNNGLFDQTDAIIKASSDNALKNVWEYGNVAVRSSATINALATELGLTEAQIDEMFVAANLLAV